MQDMHTSDVFRCLDVDGIIGANLMRQAFWNLDYKNQEIIFSDSLGALPLDSSYLEIGFVQMTQGTPKVNFVINDVEAKNIVFDTGSNRGFLFPLSILKEMRGLHNLKESIELGSTSYGIGGASKADSIFHVRVDRISMGSMQLPSSVISFDKHSNTFGTEVLEQFNIILDWEGNRIYLKPISEFILNLETHGFGVNMSDGHFEVGSIFLDIGVDAFIDETRLVVVFILARPSREQIIVQCRTAFGASARGLPSKLLHNSRDRFQLLSHDQTSHLAMPQVRAPTYGFHGVQRRNHCRARSADPLQRSDASPPGLPA